MQLSPTLGNDVFGMIRADFGNTWMNADDIGSKHLEHGFLVGAGADTLIGTCLVGVGKAEGLNTRFYFSIGNTF